MADELTKVDEDDDGAYPNPCARCGLTYSTGMPDPCIGMIPGANEACCGHGGTIYPDDCAYIIFPSDGQQSFEDRILIEFPLGTTPETVKAVGLAISGVLGRQHETQPRPFVGKRAYAQDREMRLAVLKNEMDRRYRNPDEQMAFYNGGFFAVGMEEKDDAWAEYLENPPTDTIFQDEPLTQS